MADATTSAKMSTNFAFNDFLSMGADELVDSNPMLSAVSQSKLSPAQSRRGAVGDAVVHTESDDNQLFNSMVEQRWTHESEQQVAVVVGHASRAGSDDSIVYPLTSLAPPPLAQQQPGTSAGTLVPKRKRGRPATNSGVAVKSPRSYTTKPKTVRETPAYRDSRDRNNLSVRQTREKQKQEQEYYRQIVDDLHEWATVEQAEKLATMKDIEDLKTENMTLKKDIEDLKSDKLAMKKDFEDLKTQYLAMKKDIDDLQAASSITDLFMV